MYIYNINVKIFDKIHNKITVLEWLILIDGHINKL